MTYGRNLRYHESGQKCALFLLITYVVEQTLFHRHIVVMFHFNKSVLWCYFINTLLVRLCVGASGPMGSLTQILRTLRLNHKVVLI